MSLPPLKPTRTIKRVHDSSLKSPWHHNPNPNPNPRPRPKSILVPRRIRQDGTYGTDSWYGGHWSNGSDSGEYLTLQEERNDEGFCDIDWMRNTFYYYFSRQDCIRSLFTFSYRIFAVDYISLYKSSFPQTLSYSN